MFDIWFLIAAFAGGIFGAAVGALPNFIMCGFAAMIGAGIAAATGDQTFSNLIAWGPILGPQVGFAGGAAAAAYAAKKGKLAAGRDIATGLMGLKAPDVLLVGGAFGALGYVLQWGLNQVPAIAGAPFTNTIALSIVINAIIARLMFGKTGVFGKPEGNRWVQTEKAQWLVFMSNPIELILLAVGVSLPVAYVIQAAPGLAGVFFGIGAAALVFLQFGVTVPVTHHVALAATLAVAATGDIWWGLTFGILGAFFGEIWACVFTVHGDSHIDPPSASLATTFFIQTILNAAGVMALTGVTSLIIAVVVGAAFFGLMTALRGSAKKEEKAPAAA